MNKSKKKEIFIIIFFGVPSLVLNIIFINFNPDKNPRDMHLKAFFAAILILFLALLCEKILFRKKGK